MLCAKNENSMTDYLGRFLLRFHALIDLYRLTFFAENQFLNWFSLVLIVRFVPLPSLLSSKLICGLDFSYA